MRIVLLVAGLLIGSYTYGQLEMKIEKLVVQDFIIDSTILEEDSGPYIGVLCSIENNTDTVRTIQFKKVQNWEEDADFIYCYHYNSRNYRVSHADMFPIIYAVIEGDTLYCDHLPVKYAIKPHGKIKVGSGVSLLNFTSIWKNNKFDYTLELLMILPTLEVIFKGPDFELSATEVKKVIVYP